MSQNPLYIKGLVNSLEKKVSEIKWKPDLIIASYHGIPKYILTKEIPINATVRKQQD